MPWAQIADTLIFFFFLGRCCVLVTLLHISGTEHCSPPLKWELQKVRSESTLLCEMQEIPGTQRWGKSSCLNPRCGGMTDGILLSLGLLVRHWRLQTLKSSSHLFALCCTGCKFALGLIAL